MCLCAQEHRAARQQTQPRPGGPAGQPHVRRSNDWRSKRVRWTTAQMLHIEPGRGRGQVRRDCRWDRGEERDAPGHSRAFASTMPAAGVLCPWSLQPRGLGVRGLLSRIPRVSVVMAETCVRTIARDHRRRPGRRRCRPHRVTTQLPEQQRNRCSPEPRTAVHTVRTLDAGVGLIKAR